MDGTKLLTLTEGAVLLRLHPNTVYRLVKQGEIPFIQGVGRRIRLRASDLNRWLVDRSYTPPKAVLAMPPLALSGYDKVGLQEVTELSNGGKRWSYGIGSVILRKTITGEERYYVDYQVGKRRVRKAVRGARTRADAVRVLNSEIGEAYRSVNKLKAEVTDIRFDEMAELFMEKFSKPNKKSWKTTDWVFLRRLVPVFGKKMLSEITVENVEEYKANRLSSGLKKSSVNREISCLRKVFNVAKAWRYAEENPVCNVKLFSENESLRERELLEPEETRLLQACSGHLRPILIVALNTGMRRGEIFKLKWADVDVEKREIRIAESKSGKMRFLPTNSALLGLLKSLMGQAKSEGHIFLNPESGKPYTDVKRAFDGACRRAGVKNLRFHDLRHTFASRLVRRGADLKIVQELMGHASIVTTQRYLHVLGKEKLAAVERLIEPCLPSQPCQKSVISDQRPKAPPALNSSPYAS